MNEVLFDLSARLGHEMNLKDEQNQAIEHLLCGRDVLLLLPTDSFFDGFGLSAIVICPLEGYHPRSRTIGSKHRGNFSFSIR